jgi:predicted lipoprotein
MTSVSQNRFSRSQIILAGAVIVVLAAMALDTKIVVIGSAADVTEAVFEPATFGAKTFPEVQADVTARAVDAVELATAIAADAKAATAKYAIGGVFPVKLTGVVGEGKSGIYFVTVDGLPAPLTLRVQTGPAINGTELRDVTGKINFADFTNQIEFQDAGSAINNVLKTEVLAKIDNSALTGKTIALVGAFKLVNPKSWLITPVALEVK